MKKAILAAVALAAVVCCTAALPRPDNAQAYAEGAGIYESFDDYETAYDRSGVAGGIYAQMTSWSGAAATFEAGAGNPVGSAEGKSLKLTQKGNAHIDVWANGTKDASKLDQSGAKYVKFYVRNLSAAAREIGVYLTDILQSTVDSFATAGNATPDSGQEHWTLKYNKPVVLETLAGEKSVVRSVNGNTIEIPQGFEGSVGMPITEGYLENPDWWLAEGHTFGNGMLDTDRLFMVSFCLPVATNIEMSDESSWSVFEVDNVSLGKDDGVADYIASQEAGGDTVSDEEILRPTSSKVKLDYTEKTVTVAAGMTKESFEGCFNLASGYSLTVTDEFGFPVTSVSAVLENNSVVVFTDGNKSLRYMIIVTAAQGEGGPRGCNGSISVTAGGAVLALGCAGALTIGKKRKK